MSSAGSDLIASAEELERFARHASPRHDMIIKFYQSF